MFKTPISFKTLPNASGTVATIFETHKRYKETTEKGKNDKNYKISIRESLHSY